jgi:hypothetical protein
VTSGLRLMIFDRTERRLGPIWAAGARLYRQRGLLDASRGVASWEEGLGFIAEQRPDQPIAEIQFWGHGKWGDARVGAQRFSARNLSPEDPLAPLLARIKRRLLGAEALFWFRTCETLGAKPGQRFATALGDALGCRVAGHTFVIAYWQSGLHVLAPGETPGWDVEEGLAAGTGDAPLRARHSLPWAPNTITCLQGRIPANQL